jgi:hypothetical protein
LDCSNCGLLKKLILPIFLFSLNCYGCTSLQDIDTIPDTLDELLCQDCDSLARLCISKKLDLFGCDFCIEPKFEKYNCFYCGNYINTKNDEIKHNCF